jgi:hypothetical protein
MIKKKIPGQNNDIYSRCKLPPREDDFQCAYIKDIICGNYRCCYNCAILQEYINKKDDLIISMIKAFENYKNMLQILVDELNKEDK